MTVYSFYANKTITTGEGGIVVTRDAALAKHIHAILRMTKGDVERVARRAAGALRC